ncbi:MAG TPA: peptidylprolyl isomerase [Candidatus Nanoarchaeia archaeon]|nr:peptidylprolyl isomerase [Candidatus Nanoarchaeia archaeon]
MTKIKKGDKIKVEYTGSFENGEIFDSSNNHGQPLEFEVGSGQMIKGFDQAVIGMEKNQVKEIVLNPEEAYGELNPEFKKKVPREQLPQEQEPQIGMVLGVSLPNGQQFPARITEINGNEVTIDFNHPLSGKTLKFKLKIVEINGS